MMFEEREVCFVVVIVRVVYFNFLYCYNGSGCDFMMFERLNWLKKKNFFLMFVQSIDYGKFYYGKFFFLIEFISVNM